MVHFWLKFSKSEFCEYNSSSYRSCLVNFRFSPRHHPKIEISWLGWCSGLKSLYRNKIAGRCHCVKVRTVKRCTWWRLCTDRTRSPDSYCKQEQIIMYSKTFDFCEIGSALYGSAIGSGVSSEVQWGHLWCHLIQIQNFTRFVSNWNISFQVVLYLVPPPMVWWGNETQTTVVCHLPYLQMKKLAKSNCRKWK